MSPSCVAAVSTAWNTASMLSEESVSKRARAALVKVMESIFGRPPLLLRSDGSCGRRTSHVQPDNSRRLSHVA